MLKAAGCCLVVYASIMTGHAIGQRQLRMVKELEELLLFIQLVKGQIIYAGPELPEILQDSEARLSGTIRQWVHRLVELLDMDSDMTFAQLWTESTTVLAEKSALSPAMVADVDRLGKIVGDMDVDAQISRINLVEDILTDRYQRERERCGKVRRLSGSLGLLGGIFIVILLM